MVSGWTTIASTQLGDLAQIRDDAILVVVRTLFRRRVDADEQERQPGCRLEVAQ